MESKTSFVVNSMGIVEDWDVELCGDKDIVMLSLYGEEESAEMAMNYSELTSFIEHLEEAKREMVALRDVYYILDRDIETLGGGVFKKGTVVDIVSEESFCVTVVVEATGENIITGADRIRKVSGIHAKTQ